MNPNSTQHPPGSASSDDPSEAVRPRRAGDEATSAAETTRRLLGRFTPMGVLPVSVMPSPPSPLPQGEG